MARVALERPVLASLFDRLIDEEPAQQSEAPRSRTQSVRALKEALRRDLEWLLNTRSGNELLPEEFSDLQSSVYGYGLLDIASCNLVSASGRARLQRAIQHAVQAFEPRLANVTVIPADTQVDPGRAVCFVISGLLRMEPAPEHVCFDTVLELGRGEYRVRGAD